MYLEAESVVETHDTRAALNNPIIFHIFLDFVSVFFCFPKADQINNKYLINNFNNRAFCSFSISHFFCSFVNSALARFFSASLETVSMKHPTMET